MKKNLIITILVILLIIVLVLIYLSFNTLIVNKIGGKNNYTTLNKYYEAIDYSCQTDSDCIVKDIRNCCGYYPSCTAKNAVVDADFVRKVCERDNLSSICGFPVITGCKCVSNKCANY